MFSGGSPKEGSGFPQALRRLWGWPTLVCDDAPTTAYVMVRRKMRPRLRVLRPGRSSHARADKLSG